MKLNYHITQSKLHLADMSKIHPDKPYDRNDPDSLLYCVQCEGFVENSSFNTDCPKGK